MFQPPQPGYSLMQLPQQAQQQFQQAPGMTPAMAQSQNMMAMQQAQQQQQQNSPMGMAGNLLKGGGQDNPLAGIQKMVNPRPNGQPSLFDMMPGGGLSMNQHSANPTGTPDGLSTSWLQRLFGGGGGGWFS